MSEQEPTIGPDGLTAGERFVAWLMPRMVLVLAYVALLSIIASAAAIVQGAAHG